MYSNHLTWTNRSFASPRTAIFSLQTSPLLPLELRTPIWAQRFAGQMRYESR